MLHNKFKMHRICDKRNGIVKYLAIAVTLAAYPTHYAQASSCDITLTELNGIITVSQGSGDNYCTFTTTNSGPDSLTLTLLAGTGYSIVGLNSDINLFDWKEPSGSLTNLVSAVRDANGFATGTFTVQSEVPSTGPAGEFLPNGGIGEVIDLAVLNAQGARVAVPTFTFFDEGDAPTSTPESPTIAGVLAGLGALFIVARRQERDISVKSGLLTAAIARDFLRPK